MMELAPLPPILTGRDLDLRTLTFDYLTEPTLLLASVEATGADTVTGCDSGCLMNIADAMRRRGMRVRVAHIAQLLAEGL